MTTHLTKIWWDLNKHKLVEQAIPESEIYKREWVGLTDEDLFDIAIVNFGEPDLQLFIEMGKLVQEKLKEKNT